MAVNGQSSMVNRAMPIFTIGISPFSTEKDVYLKTINGRNYNNTKVNGGRQGIQHRERHPC
jgi:hypothetical protein